MNRAELERRKPVWIGLSDLWLDNEIDEEWAKRIAEVIVQSGYSASEIDDIFVYELAPFLGPNHWSVAGEWSGFDPDWVCEEARKRIEKRSLITKIASRSGLSTYAARDAFNQVKKIAFGESDAET